MRVIRINVGYSILKRGSIGVSYEFKDFMNILSTYKIHDPFFDEIRKRYLMNVYGNRYVIAFRIEDLKDSSVLHRYNNWRGWVFFTTANPYETVDMEFEDPFSIFRAKPVDGGLL